MLVLLPEIPQLTQSQGVVDRNTEGGLGGATGKFGPLSVIWKCLNVRLNPSTIWLVRAHEICSAELLPSTSTTGIAVEAAVSMLLAGV